MIYMDSQNSEGVRLLLVSAGYIVLFTHMNILVAFCYIFIKNKFKKALGLHFVNVLNTQLPPDKLCVRGEKVQYRQCRCL